jgi:transposase
MSRLDPAAAAQYALIAICLVLVGALLTPGQVGVNERGAILAAIATVLFAIAWRGRRGDAE